MDPGLSPNTWGARFNYDAWNDRAYIKDKVVIHYNGGAISNYLGGQDREMRYLRAVEKFHIDSKRWRGIAYGWAVGASGVVYRLRGWNNYAAHTGDVEPDWINENKEAIPVLFILGGSQEPTEEMLESFRELHEFFEAHPQSDHALEVIGHKDVSSTACPGVPTYELIQAEFWLDGSQEDDVTLKELVKSDQLALKEAGFVGADGQPLRLDGALGPNTQHAKNQRDKEAFKSASGIPGQIGPIGPQGTPGVTGRDGATGPRGERGASGVDGADGTIVIKAEGVREI